MRLILIRPSLDMTCAHRLLRALGLAFVGMLTLQCALTTDHWAESSSARTRLCARSNDRIESTSEVRITNATDLQRAIEPSHKRAYDELIGRYVSGRAPVFRGHLDARYEIAEPVYADRCPATPTRVSGGALAAIEEHVPDNTYDRLLIANAEQTARVEIIKKRELNAQRVRVDMFLGTGRCALNVMSESSADDALFSSSATNLQIRVVGVGRWCGGMVCEPIAVFVSSALHRAQSSTLTFQEIVAINKDRKHVDEFHHHATGHSLFRHLQGYVSESPYPDPDPATKGRSYHRRTAYRATWRIEPDHLATLRVVDLAIEKHEICFMEQRSLACSGQQPCSTLVTVCRNE